jgi:hypothetical protein
MNPEISESKNEEKLNVWNQKSREIEIVRDKKGKGIDGGIKDTVIALSLLDINTTGSCEGHIDWGKGGPYIDIEAKESAELENKMKEEKIGGNEEKIKEEKIKKLEKQLARLKQAA